MLDKARADPMVLGLENRLQAMNTPTLLLIILVLWGLVIGGIWALGTVIF